MQHYPAIFSPDISAIDALEPLVDEFVRSHATFPFRTDYKVAFSAWLQEMIRDENAVVFCARAESELVGMVVGTMEQNASTLLLPVIGYIAGLVVSSRHRRKGTGAKWQEVRNWFLSRGIKEIQLDTSVDNDGARAFWQACHFEVFLERRKISCGLGVFTGRRRMGL